MQTLTARHLENFGCPADCHVELMQTGMSFDDVRNMAGEAAFAGRRMNWPAMLGFIRKYGPLATGLFAAYASGSFVGVLAFIVANAEQFPTLLADFLAIFA